MELAIVLSVIGTTTGIIALVLSYYTHRHTVKTQNLRVAYDLYAQAVALGAEDSRWTNMGKSALLHSYDFVGRCVDEGAFPKGAKDYWFGKNAFKSEDKAILRKYVELETEEDARSVYSGTLSEWLYR